MSVILEKIDDAIIFDAEHIIMNYLKMNAFNQESLKGTNIQLSQNLISNFHINNSNQNYQKFATEYFSKLIQSSSAIDLLSQFIKSFPNSNLGLFSTILLNQNFIELSQILNNSPELFQKYKDNILSIFLSVLSKPRHPKILENISSCFSVLIIIGFQGQWTSAIDQLISAAKQLDINSENNLITALILGNIENIFNKLDEKIDRKSSKLILSLIDSYSTIINVYIDYLLKNAFSGEKGNFVNGILFKAFISILQSSKIYKINIIKIKGFLDFLINCISYINIDNDFIVKICEVFDNAFNSNDNGLKYYYEKNPKKSDFIIFINNIIKNQDFMEISNCLKLIQNMTKYFINKYSNKIPNDEKDIQILFASCNIFNSILENYGYIFFIPDLDEIVQDIYNYFINLKIYKINQILFSSLSDLYSLTQSLDYKFENYSKEIIPDKMNKFLSFLYSIQNSILDNIKLTNGEINSINIEKDINSNKLFLNSYQLDKYINILLKDSIELDDKKEYLENSDEFFNDIYDIINSLFDGKDYCDKLCKYLLSSTENKDYITIDSIINIFNFLSFKIMNEYPDFIFNMIDFIFNKKDILFQSERFILQFIKLLYKNHIQIAKNNKCLNSIIVNLVLLAKKSEKLNQVIIILTNKLILTSYQCFKLNNDDNTFMQNINSEKEIIGNIFNILSNYLMEKLLILDPIFLYKLIEAFYNSLFYTVALNINNIESIIEVSEKLIKEANQILYLNNNNHNENINKYIFIILCITKNIGKEKKEILFNLLNKTESNGDIKQEKYFTNIQNNILNIIDSNKANNYNNDVINNIISLNNSFISIFMDKTIHYFDFFNQIITLVLSINKKYPKIFNLTLNLYTQIMTYNVNTDKYNDITKIGFDVLNSINILYGIIKNQDDIIYLANKQTEFLILYMQRSSDFIKNLNNNEVFFKTFANILNIFEQSNQKDFSINLINLIKFLIDFSNNNNIFQNILKEKFMAQIIKTIITHIQYFNATYQKCMTNSFLILINCINSIFEEKLYNALFEIYNDRQIIDIILKYLKEIKNNNKYSRNNEKIKEFMNSLNQIYHGTNKTKYEFIEKYELEINSIIESNNNNNNAQTIKVKPNYQIYMDLNFK